jgi:hypothetical protein
MSLLPKPRSTGSVTERISRPELAQGALVLPDPDDRHVLAAAIRAGAQSVVTFNLKDFPDDTLGKYGVEAKHPDEFVLDQIELAPGAIVNVITVQAQSLKDPTSTVQELLNTLAANGLVQSVARLRELLG